MLRINKFIVFISSVSILLSSCSSTLTEKENFKLVKLDSLKTTFTKKNIQLNDYILSNAKANELTKKDKLLLEELLLKCIAKHNTKTNKASATINFDAYKWFGVPLKNANGDIMVYIKAYKSNVEENWKSFDEIYCIKKGGKKYIHALINLTYQRHGALISNQE